MSSVAPRVTLIVPTYQGADRIATCLDDFAAQTLAPELFEVVVVQNGPPTETPRVVADWKQRHPDYNVRLIETDIASAQNARNIVLDGAAGPIADWVGFVDDDDRLQPRYLEALLDAAEPGRVPYGLVGITWEGRPGVDYSSWLTSVRPLVGKRHTNADVWPALQAAWAKIAERSVIGDVRFDPSIRYADDTVFWMEVFARSGARVALTDFRDDSAYLWVQREGTITRKTEIDEWQTYVVDKIDAIARMQQAAAQSSDPDTAATCDGVCGFFWGSVHAHLQREPHRLDELREGIHERGIVRVPWQLLHDGLGGRLAFVDPQDKAAVGRLADGTLTTVVATRPLGAGERAVRQRLDDVLTGMVTLPVAEVSWQLVGAVTTQLRGFLDDAARLRALLTSLRTDSEAPLEHLLGALMKLAYPQWPWTAYLGAPAVARRGLAAGAGGKAAVQPDDTFAVLGAGLGAARLGIEEVPETMGALAELAVVALADTVELVDDHQVTALRERLRANGATDAVLARVDQVVRTPSV